MYAETGDELDRNTVFSLDGKKAFVTGAASGIGVGFARGLAMFGADVACADLNYEGAQQTAKSLQDEFGVDSFAAACNTTKEPEVAQMVDACIERFGTLDIAVANAGIAGDSILAHEMPLEEFMRVVTVDLMGTFLTDKHALRVMKDKGHGKIVNNASTWAWAGSGLINAPHYTAAKAGVLNLTRELAVEYAEYGIHVNAICPGFFRSKIGGFDIPEFVATVESRIRLPYKIGEPEDLIGALVFLASDASNYMTGSSVTLDCGWLAE